MRGTTVVAMLITVSLLIATFELVAEILDSARPVMEAGVAITPVIKTDSSVPQEQRSLSR